MPEMLFHIVWPDGEHEACYSPSLVVREHLSVGQSYPLPDFITRSRTALTEASERVRARYGMPCGRALGQLRRLEATAARFGADDAASVRIERFENIQGTAAMSDPAPARHLPVAVIGGGQAGLAMSHCLTTRGIEHVVFEKRRIAHSWRSERWDNFCLVTPNWQCLLPGHPYRGDDPHGFMLRDEIVAYVESYARAFDAPVREGVGVTRVSRHADAALLLETTTGSVTADAVVLAVGGYHRPKIPSDAERLPRQIVQLHSSTYRNPGQLPPGAVLVVGSGQSGCQIAEDLHLAGRRVHLVVGSAPRCPRFYRGRDAVDWLADLGQYDLPVEQHPLKEAVRRKANHYLTGRDGGRDIDLRKFALEGMVLHGRLEGVADGTIEFRDDLAHSLDGADSVYNGICTLIDKHIAERGIAAPPPGRYRPVWQPQDQPTALDPVAAGIGSVIWSTGFRADWSWVDLPMFDGAGYPTHRRGVTAAPGVFVLGLPWLHTWGSGRFVGVGRDAEFLAAQIDTRLGADATRGVATAAVA